MHLSKVLFLNVVICCASNIIISGQRLSFNNARIKLYATPESKGETKSVTGSLNSTVLPAEYEKIECVNQGIEVLLKNSVSGVTVKELILQDNGMKDIEEDAFVDVESIKILDLSHNQLTHLRRNTISRLPTLEKLILQDNRISQIDNQAFKNLRIETLNLEDNDLDHYDPQWFSKTNKNLRTLNLKFNKIAMLPSSAFRAFESIDDILLKGNQLKEIHPEAFKAVHKLTTLDLSDNSLKTLHKDTFRTFNGIAADNPDARRFAPIDSMHVSFFDSFTGIQSLYIHNNSFTFLPQKLLSDVKHNLSYINLHTNPWQCTCYRNLEKWAEKNRISINIFNIGCINNDNPICVVPSQDADKCVESYKEELLEHFMKNFNFDFTRYDRDVRCF